jgi:hypothetical protein
VTYSPAAAVAVALVSVMCAKAAHGLSATYTKDSECANTPTALPSLSSSSLCEWKLALELAMAIMQVSA